MGRSILISLLLVDINLSALQKTLDSQGLEIIDNQKENMVGRKKLAEQTRGEKRDYVSRYAKLMNDFSCEDFRKVSDEEKLGMFKTLLKGASMSKSIPGFKLRIIIHSLSNRD